MPAELHALYVLGNEAGDTEFLFRYDMDGSFYDVEFSNATEVDQSLSMGADIVLGESGSRRRAVDTAFFVGTPSRDEFRPRRRLGARRRDRGRWRDRHRGRQRSVLVSRLPACRAISSTRWAASRGGSTSSSSATSTSARSSSRTSTTTIFYTGVDIDYDFSDVMTLRFGLRQYRTVYDERPARDLTGALLDTNPAQEYAYRGVQLGLVTRRLGRAVELEADYLRLDRTDEFLGYYDYTQDVLRVGVRLQPDAAFRHRRCRRSRAATITRTHSRSTSRPGALASSTRSGSRSKPSTASRRASRSRPSSTRST